MAERDRELFLQLGYALCQAVTGRYSTSFASSIRFLRPERQKHIHAVYAMVRLADEIVDAGFAIDTAAELLKYKDAVFQCIQTSYSSDPILYAFQDTFHRFSIDIKLVTAFFESMETDLTKRTYSSNQELADYIYGSAEVVGLMSLAVFTNGDTDSYEKLKKSAMALGSAFQKINFLRDLSADLHERGRSYFQGITATLFTETHKLKLVHEAEKELLLGLTAAEQLPKDSRIAVLVAGKYYATLLKRIENTPAQQLLSTRVRVPNWRKFFLALQVLTKNALTS